MATTYKTIAEAQAARLLEWDALGRTVVPPTFYATELGGETGEALNVVKKLEREAMGLPGSRASVFDLALELADVMICARNLAIRYGIDVDAVVVTKFNDSSDKAGLDTYVQTSSLEGRKATEWWKLQTK